MQESLKLTVAYYGGIDVMVSNAGVVRAGNLDELSYEDFQFVTMINYNAYFILVKYTQKIMKLQHEVDSDYWMDIIQINSKSGLVGSKNNSAYAGSKFGGLGLTQSFGLELADFNIKVNAICPGFFIPGQHRTLFTNDDGSYTARGNSIIAHTPFKRFGVPEELLGTLHYLASDASKFVTGTVAIVDGGFDAFSI